MGSQQGREFVDSMKTISMGFKINLMIAFPPTLKCMKFTCKTKLKVILFTITFEKMVKRENLSLIIYKCII